MRIQASRQLQARVNDLQNERQEESRDALANITNSAAAAGTEDDKQTEKEVRFIESCGKKFVATRMLWLPEGLESDVFAAETDPLYNDLDRFSTDEGDQPANKIQGALKDVLETIPEGYYGSDDFDDWVLNSFITGMNSQHSATAHRLRSHPDLFDCTSRQFSTPEGRSEFRELIGRREDDDGLSFYDTTNVPILHKNYNGEFDVDTFMLHPALFTHATIMKGPSTATAIKNSTSAPKCESVQELWRVRKTTPGMIAANAVWLRWVHSEDSQFTPLGNATGIDWRKEFEFYLNYLTNGLIKKKKCVERIFRIWDQKFYPNSDEGMARGADTLTRTEASQQAAMEALNAQAAVGEDDDDEVSNGA
ncbi:hypothetical protein DFH08DRAFT_714777 [Mycena albidolilacea]|uniref:Uncharacterized protein n=1 Tax=Mycena albidolilacea TaxID=1033008 RepID=A0AAD6ZDX1_9AGAR|nr:hypothetical protein DFH08DRAFT_714777 [Mycena albidolilacea]